MCELLSHGERVWRHNILWWQHHVACTKAEDSHGAYLCVVSQIFNWSAVTVLVQQNFSFCADVFVRLVHIRCYLSINQIEYAANIFTHQAVKKSTMLQFKCECLWFLFFIGFHCVYSKWPCHLVVTQPQVFLNTGCAYKEIPTKQQPKVIFTPEKIKLKVSVKL